MVWRNLGLNPGLPDHWWTLYPLIHSQLYDFKYFKQLWFHHQVTPATRSNLTLSHCPSLSTIALSRSSKQHPVFTQSWCNCLLTSQQWDFHLLESIRKCHMSSSKLLQQCPSCLFCLTWLVYEMEDRCCFVGCCFQDLFKTACNIFV